MKAALGFNTDTLYVHNLFDGMDDEGFFFRTPLAAKQHPDILQATLPEARKLVFDGTVRIDGRFKGEIRTDNVLVIGQGAHVDAQIMVGSIVVNGEVTGDIIAKHSVEIHAPGKLRGNVATPQLMIDKGVIFEGTCKMDEAQASKPAASVTLLTYRDKDET